MGWLIWPMSWVWQVNSIFLYIFNYFLQFHPSTLYWLGILFQNLFQFALYWVIMVLWSRSYIWLVNLDWSNMFLSQYFFKRCLYFFLFKLYFFYIKKINMTCNAVQANSLVNKTLRGGGFSVHHFTKHYLFQ